ncbi:Uncharacterised protein [Vibrio cholerae]|uniref:Uncharacterized protein n=1 Tax=Vibrio cholerae TaxID=666 RepID=A0A655ZI11_VIBCL|nr:Uncharacterised protein [Vibrio cholerae]
MAAIFSQSLGGFKVVALIWPVAEQVSSALLDLVVQQPHRIQIPFAIAFLIA